MPGHLDWQAVTLTIILDIPGIHAMKHHTDEELRSLTLEALCVAYPSTTWARAYKDESTEEAEKKAEVEFSLSSLTADPSGSLCLQGSSQPTTELRAYTLLAAAQTLTQEDRLPTNTVFWTDYRSILQSLQSPGGEQIFSNIRQQLSLLKNKTSVTLQWIPSHCGVGSNKEADWLSKVGSKLQQSAHPMSNFRTEWQQRLDTGTEEDSIHQPDKQHKSQSLN